MACTSCDASPAYRAAIDFDLEGTAVYVPFCHRCLRQLAEQQVRDHAAEPRIRTRRGQAARRLAAPLREPERRL